MNLDKAVDRNKELKAELVREGRLEKAQGIQLGIEAIERLQDARDTDFYDLDEPLLGETED